MVCLMLVMVSSGCGAVTSAGDSPSADFPSSADSLPERSFMPLAASPVPWPSPASSFSLELSVPGAAVYEGRQPPYSRTGSPRDRVHLVNNSSAADPTWNELLVFITADDTDRTPYVEQSFVCADFAEVVHNNAEEAGIRSGYVGIDFEGAGPGHALNVFHTTDRGLVFVDCTHSREFEGGRAGSVCGAPESWDKLAYVAIGRPYGLVDAETELCPAYSCFIEFDRLRDDFRQASEQYNQDVEAYNEWVSGRVFIEGSESHRRMVEWQQTLVEKRAELDKRGKSLGPFWQPMGTVAAVNIYW